MASLTKRTFVQTAMDSYLPRKKRGRGRPKRLTQVRGSNGGRTVNPEKLKALDRVEEEAKSGGAAPEGSSKREQREAFVKIQRECKDERIKLQKVK